MSKNKPAKSAPVDERAPLVIDLVDAPAQPTKAELFDLIEECQGAADRARSAAEEVARAHEKDAESAIKMLLDLYGQKQYRRESGMFAGMVVAPTVRTHKGHSEPSYYLRKIQVSGETV